MLKLSQIIVSKNGPVSRLKFGFMDFANGWFTSNQPPKFDRFTRFDYI